MGVVGVAWVGLVGVGWERGREGGGWGSLCVSV